MKRTYTLILAALLSLDSFSQIPNESFENWTNGMPDDWFSSGGTAYVLPDSNSHSGFLAARVQTALDSTGIAGTTFATRIINNNNSSYYPLGNITPPTSVQFWAITNLLNGDMLRVNTTLKSGMNIAAAINGTCVSTNSSTYQLYNFPITYILPGSLPDSGATWFSIVNTSCFPNSNQLHLGSFAIIDGISFDNPTAAINENGYEIIQSIYPNPAASFTTLNYQLKKSSDVKIQFYNVYGEIIQERIETMQPAGLYSFPINITAYFSGIYFVSLTTYNGREISKLIINK